MRCLAPVGPQALPRARPPDSPGSRRQRAVPPVDYRDSCSRRSVSISGVHSSCRQGVKAPERKSLTEAAG